MDCAPVVIPTLCRYEHFKRCIESLKKNSLAKFTTVFIALDYPASDKHFEGYSKIKEYVNTIEGFKEVKIILREENWGAKENLKNVKELAFEKFDKIIISEDDNEFSPNFLDYLNKGLMKFQNDPKIFAICGNVFPVEFPSTFKANHFFFRGFSAWGYGIWKDRYDVFEKNFSLQYVERILSDSKAILKLFNKRRSRNVLSLLHMKKNKQIYGDSIIGTTINLNGQYCVFPTVSLVRNHGHDGTGIRSQYKGENNKYSTQKIDLNKEFIYSLNISVGENITFENIISKYHFNTSAISTLKIMVKYIFYKIFKVIF